MTPARGSLNRRACTALLVMLALGIAEALAAPKPVKPTPAPPTTPVASPSEADLLPFKDNPRIANEMEPDKLCRHVEENTDIWQKMLDYGGVEAQSRLQMVLKDDFQYAQLTEDDKQLLRYLAYTTIWVPTWVESGLGKLTSQALVDQADAANARFEQEALDRLKEQLAVLSGTIADFPGNLQLVLNHKYAGGASAQPGGLILINDEFLVRMDEDEGIRRLILAHELSHLYKRHTIKELQYQLITSRAGFELGRKLLRRFSLGGSSTLVQKAKDAIALTTASKELYDFVRSHQQTFHLNQEFEADACSVEWMKRAHYDPQQLWKAFGDLGLVAQADQTTYTQTHPSTDDRRANIAQAMRSPSPVKGSPAKRK